jgi:serine/threonine protein phosphatase PrpC
MSLVSIPDGVAIEIAGRCDRGKVRKENQNTVRHIKAQLGDLLVVAEGIGGCTGGVEASRIAVDTITSSFEGMPAFVPPRIAVEEAICHANAAIVVTAVESDCPDSRAGTKVVLALLRTDAGRAHTPVQAIIGYVGDIRAYLVHNRKLALLTGDDSTERDPFGSNQITAEKGEPNEGKSSRARYLGLQLNVQVKMCELSLEGGDTLLLCSDGLWGYVAEDKIERILADGTRSVEEASRALLDLALDAGGNDNVAFEIARLSSSSDSTATGRAVEFRPEAPKEIRSVGEFAPTSGTSLPNWPDSPLNPERVNLPNEFEPPKRNKVFSLIRGLGRRTSDDDAMAEKLAAAEPVALPASGVKPTVDWATPEPIDYGTGLSSVQLNAAASVPGKFLYTPGPGYVLPAGTHTLWVTFNAADSPDNNPVLAEVSITVSKATPSIQWPTPTKNVPPGIALGAAQLNASASVPGTFEYSPAAGEVLPDGTHTLSVTFNPKDNANYTMAQATILVTVAKTVIEIDWTAPGSIPYGTPLGAAELNASASVQGTLEYSPEAGEVLPAGLHQLLVAFTPSDSTCYAMALATVSLTVTQGTPTIVWPAPEEITYGTALNDIHLNATASVPGTFLYNPGPGAVLAAGDHTPSVIFTPSNLSDYIPARAAVPLVVAKAGPSISWPAPDPINSATALGPAQLNASALIPGTFEYGPAAGQMLPAGSHTLSVTFTPADSANYALARASVSLMVTEIMPAVITWLSPGSISYGTALGDEQLSANSSVPGSFHYIPAAGHVLPPGEHKLSVIFTPEDQEKYAKVTARVTLIVEGMLHVAPLLRAVSHAQLTSGVSRSAAGAIERRDVTKRDQSAQGVERETRTYKGALYEKGDDGQWHLQKK